jgi:hypothetical protein
MSVLVRECEWVCERALLRVCDHARRREIAREWVGMCV